MSVVFVKTFFIKFQLETDEINSVLYYLLCVCGGNFPISLYYSYYRYII